MTIENYSFEGSSRQCPTGTVPYLVQRGDTLRIIARKYNTTLAAIISANPSINPNRLYVGQSICVPQQPVPQPVPAPACPIGTSPYAIKSGDTLAGIARKFSTTVEAILSTNLGIAPERLYVGQVICIAQEKTEQLICPNLNSYVVRKGDTFSSIAKAFNVSLQSLLNANPGVTPNSLYLDQVICVPIAPIPLSITVSITAKTLTLYKYGRLYKAYPVATGKPTTPTPIGTFTIKNKQVNPGGPYGPRWMGLSAPHYGIHGTNNEASIGSAASNGCVRMFNKDVEDLFDYVGVGTVVRIF
jgi:L,D-transpeptidase ErfK/SrfK